MLFTVIWFSSCPFCSAEVPRKRVRLFSSSSVPQARLCRTLRREGRNTLSDYPPRIPVFSCDNSNRRRARPCPFYKVFRRVRQIPRIRISTVRNSRFRRVFGKDNYTHTFIKRFRTFVNSFYKPCVGIGGNNRVSAVIPRRQRRKQSP